MKVLVGDSLGKKVKNHQSDCSIIILLLYFTIVCFPWIEIKVKFNAIKNQLRKPALKISVIYKKKGSWRIMVVAALFYSITYFNSLLLNLFLLFPPRFIFVLYLINLLSDWSQNCNLTIVCNNNYYHKTQNLLVKC